MSKRPPIDDRCFYAAGPYKGYCGRADYDHDEDLFHGEVLGIRDMITFQGRTITDLRKAFKDSVDDYLAFCKELGQSPAKPFSGKFVARISPDLHRTISQLAELSGKSLNQFVGECLEQIVASERVVSFEPRTATGLQAARNKKTRRKASSSLRSKAKRCAP